MSRKKNLPSSLCNLTVTNGLLLGSARFQLTQWPIVVLFIDGKRQTTSRVDLPSIDNGQAAKSYSFAIPLPQLIYDNAPHELSVKLLDAGAEDAEPTVLCENHLLFQSGTHYGEVKRIDQHYQGWVRFQQRPLPLPLLQVGDFRGHALQEITLIPVAIADDLPGTFVAHFRIDATDLPDHLHFYCNKVELKGSPCKKPSRRIGNLDSFNGQVITGWAFDINQPGVPIELVLNIDHQSALRFRPNIRRTDVERHLKRPPNSLGIVGFQLSAPELLFDGEPHHLSVTFFGTNQTLRGSQTFCATQSTIPLKEFAPPPQTKSSKIRALPRPKAPCVSIIVLNRDGAQPLQALLESWHAVNSVDPIEFIVVDHASADNSLAVLKNWQKRLPIHIIGLPINDSFSASCNLAVTQAQGEYLLFLNNDIVWLQDCLPAMLQTLSTRDDVAAVGLKLLKATDDGEKNYQVQHLGVRFKLSGPAYWPYEATPDVGEAEYAPQEVPVVTAAVMLCRKKEFIRIGQFDTAYFYGFEDVELGLRLAHLLEKKTICRNDLVALHRHGHTRLSGRAMDIFDRVVDNSAILQSHIGLWLKRRYWQSLLTADKLYTLETFTIGIVIDEPATNDTDQTTPLIAAAMAMAKRLQATNPVVELVFLPPSRGWYNIRKLHLLLVGHPLYDIRQVACRREDCLIVAWVRDQAQLWLQLPWLNDFDGYIADNAGLKKQLANTVSAPIVLAKSTTPLGLFLNPVKPPLRVALLIPENASVKLQKRATFLRDQLKRDGCVVWQELRLESCTRVTDIRIYFHQAENDWQTIPLAQSGTVNIAWCDQPELVADTQQQPDWIVTLQQPSLDWLQSLLEQAIGSTFRSS